MLCEHAGGGYRTNRLFIIIQLLRTLRHDRGKCDSCCRGNCENWGCFSIPKSLSVIIMIQSLVGSVLQLGPWAMICGEGIGGGGKEIIVEGLKLSALVTREAFVT